MLYENPTQAAQQGSNRQQADNARRKQLQANMAQRGSYPYAAEGTATAQATGAAARGAAITNAGQQAPDRAQVPPTFAELQQQGRARPAPPPPVPGTPQSPGMGPNGAAPLMQAMTGLPAPGTNAPMPGTQGTQAQPSQPPAPAPQTWTTQGAPQLQQALAQLLGAPSSYTSSDVQSTYDQLGTQIDDQFNQQVTGINEEMARRGLYDSTIAGGRLYDSEVGRRSAKTSLAQDLARQQAEKLDQARQAAVGLGLQDQGQRFQQQLGLGSQSLQREGLTLDRDRLGLDDSYRRDALSQNESQYGRSLGEQQRQFNLGQEFDYSALGQNGMLDLMRMLGLDVTTYGG